MNDTALIATFVVLGGGMMTMVICSAIAKKWLTDNTGYQASRMGTFLFGPLLTSFGPMRSYTEARRSRNLPTTVATVFWSATVVWGLGIVGLIGVLASLTH
jgi:hypothetical protein